MPPFFSPVTSQVAEAAQPVATWSGRSSKVEPWPRRSSRACMLFALDAGRGRGGRPRRSPSAGARPARSGGRRTRTRTGPRRACPSAAGRGPGRRARPRRPPCENEPPRSRLVHRLYDEPARARPLGAVVPTSGRRPRTSPTCRRAIPGSPWSITPQSRAGPMWVASSARSTKSVRDAEVRNSALTGSLKCPPRRWSPLAGGGADRGPSARRRRPGGRRRPRARAALFRPRTRGAGGAARPCRCAAIPVSSSPASQSWNERKSPWT